jgi:hypothetical protein
MACDLMVFGDRNSSAPISGNDRWVANSGRTRSSTAVSDEAARVLGLAVPPTHVAHTMLRTAPRRDDRRVTTTLISLYRTKSTHLALEPVEVTGENSGA